MKAICHCGATTTGKRLSRAWRRRGDRYICPRCWSQEPAERNSVYRYDVIAATIPPTFWRHQQTARLLWDGLCAINEQSFERVTALRARYAPAEAAVAERAREAARVAWQAVADARSKDDDREMSTEPRAAAVSRTKVWKKEQARAASQLAAAAFAEAKRAARAAGADEKPLWAARDAQLNTAALWEYEEAEQDGRRVVVRSRGTTASSHQYRLARGLADQVIEEYRTAWQAWLQQRPRGRRMPHPNGPGLGDRVRWVVRYTNGTSVARMTGGRMGSVHLSPCASSTKARAQRVRRGRLGRVEARLSMDTKTAVLTVPIDRPLPTGDDAIRRVVLAGERYGNGWRWSLQFTCREQAQFLEPPAERAEAVAIDLGWRMDDQYLQVAHCLTSDGQQLLVRVDRSARQRHAMRARAWLPSSWDDYLLGQQQVDLGVEQIKALVWAAHGTAQPQDGCEGVDRAYPEPFRLLRAGGLLRAIAAGTYPRVQARLEAWAEEYQHQRRMLARCRLRLLARRDQQYYEAAHWLCQHAKRILVEADASSQDGDEKSNAMDLRPLATADGVAANQRHIVAPYRFRQIVTQVVARYRDTSIGLVEKNRTSTTCPACGAVGKPGSRQWLTCPAGHRYHQDWGADKEMLRRERQHDREKAGVAREA